MRRDVLCKTPLGIDCPMLIITEDCRGHISYEDLVRLHHWRDWGYIQSLRNEYERTLHVKDIVEAKREIRTR